MNTIANLTVRLVALERLRKVRMLEERYKRYLERSSSALVGIQHTVKVKECCDGLIGGVQFTEAMNRTRKSVAGARRLRSKIENDPESVAQLNAEKNLTLMCENADAAWKSVLGTWKVGIDSKVKSWSPLMEVIIRLVPDKGQALRNVIILLERTSQNPPVTEKEANSVRKSLEELERIVRDLGLETSFGRFLRAVASNEGASLHDAQQTEVKAAISQHQLERVFRVRLS